MPDFTTAIAQFGNAGQDQIRAAGKAISGTMRPDLEAFLVVLLDLLKRKEIDPSDPQTFLKHEVYDKLPEEWRDNTDLALLNIADLLRIVLDFRLRRDTPDASPHLETMLDQLLHMKQSIEGNGYDVFKF